jgi:hypothetical protein
MSSASPKISTELLRELDVDNLLERRLREDAVGTRVRRIRRSPAIIEKSIQAAGMEILQEITPASAHHRKASRPSPL